MAGLLLALFGSITVASAQQTDGTSITLRAFNCPPGVTIGTVVEDQCALTTEDFAVEIVSLEGIMQPLTLADASFDGTSYRWQLSGTPTSPRGIHYGLRQTRLPAGYTNYRALGTGVSLTADLYRVVLSIEQPNALVLLYNFTDQPGTTTVARTITIFSVFCPAEAVGDGSADTCEDNPIAGDLFQIGSPASGAATEFVPTDESGLVSFEFDSLAAGDTLRVVQQPPPGAARFLAYCLDETGLRLGITYPTLPDPGFAMGAADIAVGESREVLCDWYSIPASTGAPAPPSLSAGPEPALPSTCDPSYPTLCLQSFPDLDCGEITARRFPVVPPDPHGFDGDGDGVGCESG
jgi:hypothetical protein